MMMLLLLMVCLRLSFSLVGRGVGIDVIRTGRGVMGLMVMMLLL